MTDHELVLARAGVRVGVPVAVLATAVAGLVRGPAAALTALGGVGLVVGNLYLTGRSLSWAARIGPAVLQGVALGGFVLRLVLYVLLLAVLRPVDAIDGPVLAISTVVAMVVVLVAEVRLVLRHGPLTWLELAPTDGPTAVARTDGKERP